MITSGKSLRNGLSYLIVALPAHFIVTEELEPYVYETLSEDAKCTVCFLFKKKDDKFRAILPKKMLVSDDTACFCKP